MFWDEQTKRFVGVTRIDVGAMGSREAAITFSDDFVSWTPAVAVLASNRSEVNPPNPVAANYTQKQENVFVVWQPPNTTVYVGFVVFSEWSV